MNWSAAGEGREARRSGRTGASSRATGAASADHAFLAVTNTRGGDDTITYGFLRREGKTISLASGKRLVERNAEHGWVERVSIMARDMAGRELTAIGLPVSRMIINRHTFVDINSLMRWEMNGEVAWGEDQDMWPVHAFAAARRNASFLGARPTPTAG